MRCAFLLFGIGLVLGTGCGISAVASKSFDDVVDGGDAADGSSGLKRDGSPTDAGTDAPIDGPLDVSEAGIAFAPSHATLFTLNAADVTITLPTTIDGAARTIDLNGGGPNVSPALVFDGAIAVWSVGNLTVNAKLTVTGDRPLVIVASGAVVLNALVEGAGELALPGPGGSVPAGGAGHGGDGSKSGNAASGGGGAGHGGGGALGGDKSPALGGTVGPLTNASGTAFIGGAGGGNGGGYALNTCGNRGRGGAGGGAIQISAIGKIVVTSFGGIDVAGGGGAGGCKDNGGDAFSGGGGGGAGGLVFFESVTGIQLDIGSTIEASGGSGGEGGGGNAFGIAGESGHYPIGVAIGGFGTNGGNGGNGGVGGIAPFAPGAGGTDNSGGGGGGGHGRVFFRTRGAAALFVNGNVAAQRTDDPTF